MMKSCGTSRAFGAEQEATSSDGPNTATGNAIPGTRSFGYAVGPSRGRLARTRAAVKKHGRCPSNFRPASVEERFQNAPRIGAGGRRGQTRYMVRLHTRRRPGTHRQCFFWMLLRSGNCRQRFDPTRPVFSSVGRKAVINQCGAADS